MTRPMTQDAGGLGPGSAAHATAMNMTDGLINTQLINVAARLGIADLVAEGHRSNYELAKATGTHASHATPCAANAGEPRRFRPDASGSHCGEREGGVVPERCTELPQTNGGILRC